MRIFNGKIEGTTAAGTFNENITNLNCLCHNVIVAPLSADTQYDFQIINPDDVVVFERTSETGTMSELTILPLMGTYTFKILNATKDEAFLICLVSRED